MQRTEVDLFTLVCRVALGSIFLPQLHRQLATVALESNGDEVFHWVTSGMQVDDCRMHSPTKIVGLRRGNCPGMENRDCRILGMLWSVLYKFYITLKYIIEKVRELDHRKKQQIIKKARQFQKNIYFCFIDYTKAFDCVDHNKLWKILEEMGIPDHLTWPLRNLYAGQEATVRTRHGTTDWFQIEKGVHQGCILSPCLLNLYAEYIIQNARLDVAQAGIKITGRNIITSDMQMIPPLWQKMKRN